MKTKLKKLLCFVMTIIMLVSVCSACLSVFAEGSKELNLKSDSGTGHRFFSEYFFEGKYAGISRQTMAKCYLKKGETVFFGSSVADSVLTIDDNKTSSATGADIVVMQPNGEKIPYDVIENGVGYISSRAQEINGPKLPGNESTSSDYYQPLSFNASTEGIYTFYFHSKIGDIKTPANVAKLDEDANALSGQGQSTVAFWDITVFGKNNENNNEVKKQRRNVPN